MDDELDDDERALTAVGGQPGAPQDDSLLARLKAKLLGKKIEADRDLGVKAMELAGAGINANRDLGVKTLDLMATIDNNKVKLRDIEARERQTDKAYDVAKEALRLEEIRMTGIFARQDRVLDKTLDGIGKAIDAGEWGAAVQFADKSANVVMNSPLANADERAERRKRLSARGGNITSLGDD